MDFVNGNWRVERIILRPARYPRSVAPCVASQIPHSRSCLRTDLNRESVRIGLVHLVRTELGFDVIFVNGALADIGNEAFPDPRAAWAQHVCRRIPAVEISNHRNKPYIGGPHGKMHAVMAIFLHKMGSELFVGTVVS